MSQFLTMLSSHTDLRHIIGIRWFSDLLCPTKKFKVKKSPPPLGFSYCLLFIFFTLCPFHVFFTFYCAQKCSTSLSPFQLVFTLACAEMQTTHIYSIMEKRPSTYKPDKKWVWLSRLKVLTKITWNEPLCLPKNNQENGTHCAKKQANEWYTMRASSWFMSNVKICALCKIFTKRMGLMNGKEKRECPLSGTFFHGTKGQN